MCFHVLCHASSAGKHCSRRSCSTKRCVSIEKIFYGDKELAFHNQNVFFSKTSLHFEIRSTKLFLLEKIDSANGLSSSTGSFDTPYFKSEGVDVSASKILALLKLHGSRNL